MTLALQSESFERIADDLEVAQRHDASSLQASYAVPFRADLGYDPTAAVGLDLINASSLGLNAAELALLKSNGFVIVPRHEYPTFAYGYTTIYAEDLPVFVSADMVLEAVHRSYDDILKSLELSLLMPRVQRLLSAMRAELSAGKLTGRVAADTDFYLAVAESLLTGELVEPVAGASSSEVQKFVDAASTATGEAETELYGARRVVDFSQFKPRGHYAGTPELERYFRAMIWMGRIDFRLLETREDGTRVFWRRQLEAAFGLRSLLTPQSLADWQSVDRAISAFVGEHDYMHLGQLDGLLADLDISAEAELAGLSDDRIAQVIVDEHYGEQRILSHVIRRGNGGPATLPLNASFAFFGQRYVVDSHVFSNVVYDRVPTRVLPSPLDAAFAAFGNNHAAALLSSELEQHPYASALAGTRTLVDAYAPEYWASSLYTGWLGALRTLSPAGTAGPSAEGLPAVARTEPWARRILNTQLASWAELRHDTLLYAKQSYTTGSSCEFPDAYVEPYPDFFHAIARFAELGRGIAGDLASDSGSEGSAPISAYFAKLQEITTTLGEMAELQRSGAPHAAEHVAFINQAIRVERVASGDPWQTGWYKDLFFNPDSGVKYAPTIADVHTDPGGPIPVSRGPSVLHVGTGRARLMVMTVDSCQGPRAYAGVVSSYYEHLAEGFTRLDDQQWQTLVDAAPNVPWMQSVLAPQ